MFLHVRIIIAFNFFLSDYHNSLALKHSYLKMVFSFALICSIAAVALEKIDSKARLKNMLVCRHPSLIFRVHPADWKKNLSI